MQESEQRKLNRYLIPQWLCHWRGWHKWFWTSRNRSFISGHCARCNMNGAEFWKREREMYKREADKKK
jgi:hypothetical protein